MYQNYTINQLCLPIDLEIKLEENDFAHAIVQFVDSIPDEVFLPYYQSMGRPLFFINLKMIDSKLYGATLFYNQLRIYKSYLFNYL